MRMIALVVTALACAAPAMATRCDLGDWVMLQFSMGPEPQLEIRQRFAIVGEELAADGERWVWLEMVTYPPTYPIKAQILVPDSLFTRGDGNQDGFFHATRRFVGTFGGSPPQEMPVSKVRERLGGYFTFAAGVGPQRTDRIVGEEDLAVGDRTLRCHKVDLSERAEDVSSEGALWLSDQVPIAGYVRFQSRHIGADGATTHATHIQVLGFGTGAESSLPTVPPSATFAAPADTRRPVDDMAFAEIRAYYQYDRNEPLHAEVLNTQKYDGRELPYATDKVRFRSLDDTVVGYFAYPPASAQAPCPAVVVLHGNNGFRGSRDRWTSGLLDMLAREGYCVLAIDQLAFGERLVPREELAGRDATLQHVTDVRRAIDYLGERAEVDTARLALIGESMGGLNGCLVAGLEDRLRAVVLVVAGAWPESVPTDGPGVWRKHPLNFAPRITAPTLMINATQDVYTQPPEARELQAALRVSRQLIWKKSEHSIPVEDQSKDILKWLDRYLR